MAYIKIAVWALLICLPAVCSIPAQEEEEIKLVTASQVQGGVYFGKRRRGLDEESGDGDMSVMSRAAVDTCRPEFAALKAHTMCLQDSPKVEESGVEEEEKELIVRFHNEKRGTVEPAAADLAALKYDDQLAEVAQKWAKQCVLRHDTHKARSIPAWPGVSIGQNMALDMGYPERSWERAMQGWHDEVKNFTFGQKPKANVKVGHYTQMVCNRTVRVGCGYAKCGQFSHYVCNYAIGQTTYITPYALGDRCSACPSSCKDGLCDCSDKDDICLNGGQLNKDTCKCDCGIFLGHDCANCPGKDAEKAVDLCGLGKEKCHHWNVMYGCPYMCGVCA